MAASAFTTDASCIVGMEALEASRTLAHGSGADSFTLSCLESVRSGAFGASSADAILFSEDTMTVMDCFFLWRRGQSARVHTRASARRNIESVNQVTALT